MNPWVCASLIAIAGSIGGVVNALLTDNGFVMPTRRSHVLCPGFISNVLVGAFAAFSSWAFYGSILQRGNHADKTVGLVRIVCGPQLEHHLIFGAKVEHLLMTVRAQIPDVQRMAVLAGKQ